MKPLTKTMPFVTVRKISCSNDIHIFRTSTKKPWIDKYKGREVYSLNASTGVMSGRLLVTREDGKIIIINASLATPPLTPDEYAKHASMLLKALIHRLNRLCIEWECTEIVMDKDARPYFSFLEEINNQLADHTISKEET
ncbi:hypothetical protein HAV2_gp12 [Hyperthermophilic Archaeal Virus 2]|uniref:hypothetical protein n=1 Tax=Hyperthermophilic Archaeal Virus 2 TaxID=762906 RepID=UPI0001DBAE1F|nr:hypothetical protein HAV2_gp12 [Hyperthermophilic Archaeal Virus 2]ADJ54275.1 hypothetical protein HAV2_gp12 [Hyperthermophilic Archaeal Virus 2]